MRTPPVGWFFSDNDTVGADGLGAAMAGAGLFSDLGTDLDAAFRLPPARSASIREFMRIPGRGSHEPSDQGQGGFTVQAILPRLNSTKLALHFVNYHSRLPVVSARTADAAAVAATSPAAVAARAATLAPDLRSGGAAAGRGRRRRSRRGQRRSRSGSTRARRATSRAIRRTSRCSALSFNTATLRTGTLVSGEVSHHFDYPFQILPSDVFSAAFSPIEFDPSFGQGPLGDFGPDAGRSRRREARQDAGRARAPPALRSAPRRRRRRSSASTSAGCTSTTCPDATELRLSAPGVTGPSDFDHLPDADSWGYRVLAALTYDGVLGGFTVQPHVAWLHDVGGVTPGPGGAFVEERKAINLGVSVDYTNTWLLQLDYTTLLRRRSLQPAERPRLPALPADATSTRR